MAVVKSIDIAVRSNTEDFEAGMRRSSGALKSFDQASQSVAARMAKATELFSVGAIDVNEFSSTIKSCEKEIDAINAGFMSMGDASQRAQGILRGMETETEKYSRKLDELNKLKKLGALNEAEHARAVAHTHAQFQKSIPTVTTAAQATDKWGMQFAGNLPVIGRFTGLVAGIHTPVGIATAALEGAGIATRMFRDAFDQASRMIQAGMQRIESAGNAAEQIGVLTADFQRLEFAATRADIAPDKLISGLQRMNKAISEGLTDNTSRAAQAFRALNLDVNKLADMSPDQAFKTLADAVSGLESPFDKSRYTMEIFGKSGGELVRILNEGSQGLDELGRRADGLRITTDQLGTDNVKQAMDAVHDLTKAWEGLENTLAVFAAPTLTQVLKDMTGTMEDPGKSLEGVKSKWMELTEAFIVSKDPFTLAHRFSSIYFDSVAERSATASDQISKATAPLRSAFDPSAVQDYVGFLETASKRQQQIGKSANSALQQLQSDQLKAAQSHMDKMAALSGGIAPRLQVRDLPPLQLGLKVDTSPVKELEATVARLTKQFETGQITKTVFLQQFEAAKSRLTELQETYEKFNASVIESARSTMATDEAAKNSQIDNLKEIDRVRRSGIEDWKRLVAETSGKFSIPTFTLPEFKVPELPQRIPTVAELAPGIDLNPLNTFQQKLDEIQKRFGSDPLGMSKMIAAANAELQRSQTILANVQAQQASIAANVQAKQAEIARTRLEAEEAVKARQINTLRDVMKFQRDAWVKENPALAAQESLKQKTAEIEALFARKVIPTLEARNELLRVAAEMSRKEFIGDTDGMVKGLVDSTKTPLETLQSRFAELVNIDKLTGGKIPTEIFSRAIKDAEEGFTKSFASKDPRIVNNLLMQFEKQQASLTQALDRGTISKPIFDNLIAQAQTQLDNALQRAPGMETYTPVAALDRASQEAFSAFQKARFDTRESDKSAEMSAEMKKQTMILNRIERGGIVLAKAKF